MYRASHVMYSIANFFTWLVVIFTVAAIVLCSLDLAHVIPADWNLQLGIGYLVAYIIVLIVSLITIALVRKAKAKGTSKGWDVLFLVLGILGWNVFYILGGIFGLCAKN